MSGNAPGTGDQRGQDSGLDCSQSSEGARKSIDGDHAM